MTDDFSGQEWLLDVDLDELEGEPTEILHIPEMLASDGGVFNRPRAPEDEEEGATSLWLITFTDAMALMLTFFVMLYAMGSPTQEDWDDLKDGTQRYFGRYESPEWYEGPQRDIDINKIDFSSALDLQYLSSVLNDLRAQNDSLSGVVLFPQKGHLVISLPEDLLFEAGKFEVEDVGKKALFTIGGRLANIRNRIEVIGHTDPRPIEDIQDGSGAKSNWELSLRRAMAVSDILRQVGYERDIVTRGLSSARYDELPETWELQRRLDVSRRVDILVMEDDGSSRKFMDFGR